MTLCPPVVQATALLPEEAAPCAAATPVLEAGYGELCHPGPVSICTGGNLRQWNPNVFTMEPKCCTPCFSFGETTAVHRPCVRVFVWLARPFPPLRDPRRDFLDHLGLQRHERLLVENEIDFGEIASC